MKKKPCLVIGPMGPNFMRDLTWLANEVVKPILENIEPGGFTVSTPSFPKIGNVMYQVIQACDRAPLVVQILRATIQTSFTKWQSWTLWAAPASPSKSAMTPTSKRIKFRLIEPRTGLL